MSYLVLARKHRPQSFDDVIGQEHITNSLKKAIDNNRVAHAFLFCGPRGVGKTTCARILARELNQQKTPAENEDLAVSSNLDIIEIDGASNRGIDEIRTLRENVKFVPMSGRYKIYIVDEVHMLTTEAFNALLKTLEEPPEHVKFILATTDPNKVPVTVVSRCQRYDFKRIPLEVTAKTLKALCERENISASDEALFFMAKAAQGSMRDALSILDQLSSYASGGIKAQDVQNMLGLVDASHLFEIGEAVAARNAASALEAVEKISDLGKDMKQLTQNLIELFRHLMVMKVGGEKLQALVDYPRAQKEALFTLAQKMDLTEIVRALESLVEAQETARIMESSRIALEVALVQVIATTPQTVAAAQPKPAAAPAAPVHKPAPKPVQVAQPTEAKAQGAAAKSTPTQKPASGWVNNNRGSVVIGNAPAAKGLSFDIKHVQENWNALTFAVSQKRISLASYLQEGYPVRIDGGSVVIGFSPDHAFNKECLETNENVRTISEAFSEHLKEQVLVVFEITDEEAQKATEDSIQSALEMFQGQVVNEWHNTQKEG